jgi:hypothetical protein
VGRVLLTRGLTRAPRQLSAAGGPPHEEVLNGYGETPSLRWGDRGSPPRALTSIAACTNYFPKGTLIGEQFQSCYLANGYEHVGLVDA